MKRNRRIRRFPYINYFFPTDTSLEFKISGTLFFIGGLLSTVGFILGLLFSIPFLLNLPNFLILTICFIVPVFQKKGSLGPTYVVLFIAAYFYFPFIFFTNNGLHGSAPFYFFMMFLYFPIFFNSRILFFHMGALLVYYTLVFLFSLQHPETVIPYPDYPSQIIDMLVGFIAMSVLIGIITKSTYLEYAREKKLAQNATAELIEKNKMLEEILITDQLTKVFSRQFFLEKFEQELEVSAKMRLKCYLMMIDVDNFKKVNDTYGHLIGDEVLKLVAATIRASIREHDIVARYGGEEFIVLITHSSEDNGVAIAERIRSCVAQTRYRDLEPVTVSIGVTTNRSSSISEKIIEEADSFLYAAKQNGRNRVEYSPGANYELS